MKILIIGYCASGKSTLAKKIGDILNVPVFHLDKEFFLSDWKERDKKESEQIIENILKNNKSWVIEGNFMKISPESRIKSCDKLIFMDFNRFTCLLNAYERFNKYKGAIRESAADGCVEKFDWELINWILFGQRTEKKQELYNSIIEKYKEKLIHLQNRDEVDLFLDDLKNKRIKLNK